MPVGSNVSGVVSAYTVIVPPLRAPGSSGAGPVAVGSSAPVWVPMLGALPTSLFRPGGPDAAAAVRTAATRTTATRRAGIISSASQTGRVAGRHSTLLVTGGAGVAIQCGRAVPCPRPGGDRHRGRRYRGAAASPGALPAGDPAARTRPAGTRRPALRPAVGR